LDLFEALPVGAAHRLFVVWAQRDQLIEQAELHSVSLPRGGRGGAEISRSLPARRAKVNSLALTSLRFATHLPRWSTIHNIRPVHRRLRRVSSQRDPFSVLGGVTTASCNGYGGA